MHRHRRKPRPLRLLDVAPSSYLRLSAANLSFFNPAEFFSAAALHDRAIGTNTRRWLKLANSPLIVATSPSNTRFSLRVFLWLRGEFCFFSRRPRSIAIPVLTNFPSFLLAIPTTYKPQPLIPPHPPATNGN
jgi:hypothetical protein